MLKPYMKVDVHFTTDNFTDLYNIVQEKSKSKKKNYLKKNNPKTFRNLMEFATQFTKEEDLFSYKDIGGIQINLKLKADSGLNTQAMRSFSDLQFDDKETHLSSLEEFTDIQIILDELLELSKAGNHLASQLYEKIKDKLQGITNEITLRINTLNELLMYKDLSEIFDSTLSLDSINKLPIGIIGESNSLLNKLKELHNGIKSGNVKNKADKLNSIVYNYIKQSHILIKNLFDNLRQLGNTLNSKNNKITEVTTYYLNHTSSSYINTIQVAENILINYYKNEYDLVYPKVEQLLKEFEENTKEDLQKEKKIIINLYEKLENRNFTIDLANDEDYKNIILNLYNSNQYITEIINKIKEYFKDEIGIKDSGYFISDYDINLNNNSFSSVLAESKEVAQKLDKDEYIDKLFDRIMINFRENYTNIMKYMDEQKTKQFPLDEDTLEDSLFTSNDKNYIETQMTTFRVEISKKIKDENDFYIDKIKNNISTFLTENLEQLNNLISDLNILFSEESLKQLSDLFNNAFYSCLNKITNDIKYNEALAKQYFDLLYNGIRNNNVNFYNYRYWHYYYYYRKTNAYISKYNTFIANFDYSITYLNNQLYLDILKEYKTILTNIRERLQSIKNFKITDKYPDFPELEFYNNHIRTVDKLYDRLNKYISDDLFNNKYLKPINDNIKANNEYISSIKTYINTKHKTINNLDTHGDNKNDYCGGYKYKRCYGCTNCAWYYYQYYISSCHVTQYTNNHLSLIKSSIKSDTNLTIFIQKFNDFYSKMNEKINEYNRRLQNLENNFALIKQETLDKNITLNYLSSIQNSVHTILSQKYGKEIVKASYNYYQKLIDERIKGILDNVSNQWINSYDILLSEIDSNYEDFKNSVYEFGVMAQIYETILTKNITKNYFDSIVLFQKNEFNYTISYYYNYYIKLVNEAYQYIVSKIPKNENGFNDILNQRRKEIDDIFKSFLKEITNSKNEALTFEKQTDILEVVETNFFKINSILTNNILNTSQILKDKRDEILDYIGEEGDDISLISRFYLENKENGKQIEQFYEPVNHQIFVYLNLEKFKDLLIENWIFDQDDLINRLNQTLYDTNKEIKNEFSTLKENYTDTLENEITKYFKDDSIENKINKLYLNAIKDFTEVQKQNISTNINEIINKVKDKISSEATRIETTSTSYNTDYSKIQNTLKEYKSFIFSQINSTVFNVLEDFYKNIYNNVYTKCIEEQLNEYLNQGEEVTKRYKEYALLNSTFKMGEIIYDIIDELVKNYKNITIKKINSKYNEYYKKIKNTINLDNIQNLINNQIDNMYNTKLLPALQKFAIYNPGDAQYTEYDFNNDIQTEINTTIQTKINNINNQVLLTNGTNNEDKFQCKLDCSRVQETIFPIMDSFERFLNSEKQEQNIKINNLLKSIIKSNFDDLLNNIIPTFGNEFFERIIKYNENFQISSLYNNLEYTLSQTLLYYLTLNIYKDVDAVPKDLKNRLYNLNNLDSTIENKNKQILKLLEKKISEFIQESKINIMEKYMSFLEEDVSINRSFTKDIIKKINDNLIQMQPEMEKNYQKMLEQYLKEKLTISYTNVINDKTRELVKLVNEQRETLKSKLDDLFSLDSDKVLYEVNEKINNTLDAISEYNKFFESFSISNDIKEFLNNYGIKTIQPVFENFKIQLNKATKDKIMQNIDKNSKEFENLNPNEFIQQANNISQYFNTNYISNISHSINSYSNNGNYQENLDIERSKKRARLRRRLDGTQTEEEIAEDAHERILDSGIEESFGKILSTSTNTKNYFDSLDAFKNFDKKLLKYKNNLNIASKTSKELIAKNEYEEEIEEYLNEKLNNLTNISNDYYDKINQSYFNLRDFLNKSLIEIDEELKQCANITYKTFNEEYEFIANNTNKVNSKYSNSTDKLNTIEYTKKSEHKTNKVIADLSDFREYGEFKFDLVLKDNNNIKNPQIKASIIDKSRPKTMEIEVTSPFGNCGENINKLEVELNDANYTMNIDYTTESSNINVTTYTHFEKYKYSTEVYQIGEINETESVEAMGYAIDYRIKCKKSKTKELQSKYDIYVDEKHYNETYVIQG